LVLAPDGVHPPSSIRKASWAVFGRPPGGPAPPCRYTLSDDGDTVDRGGVAAGVHPGRKVVPGVRLARPRASSRNMVESRRRSTVYEALMLTGRHHDARPAGNATSATGFTRCHRSLGLETPDRTAPLHPRMDVGLRGRSEPIVFRQTSRGPGECGGRRWVGGPTSPSTSTRSSNPSLSWADVEWLRVDVGAGRFVLKGQFQSVDDAVLAGRRRAVDAIALFESRRPATRFGPPDNRLSFGAPCADAVRGVCVEIHLATAAWRPRGATSSRPWRWAPRGLHGREGRICTVTSAARPAEPGRSTGC